MRGVGGVNLLSIIVNLNQLCDMIFNFKAVSCYSEDARKVFPQMKLIFSDLVFNTAKDYESPWTIPDTFLKRVYWVAMIPMHAFFFLTIPDCRRPGKWHKTYPFTFVMSIAWIAGLSYIMVWMVAVAGGYSLLSLL